MNDMSWRYLCEIAALLPNRAEIPASLREADFGRALDRIRETYFFTIGCLPDEDELRIPLWRIKKHRFEVFHGVLDKAYASFLSKELAIKKAQDRAHYAAIGMGERDVTPEIQEAGRRLEEAMELPVHERRHRDIVRLALKAYRPVPIDVVAEYLDEPWAVEEMIARARRLGMGMFAIIPSSRE